MKLKIYITLFLLIVISSLHAQVGIGTTTPATSSALDITSTNTGLLIPRVALTSTSDVATIASPATSLLVYNTATAGVVPNNVVPSYYYNSGTPASPVWTPLSTGLSNTNWNILGNTNIVNGTHFIGTGIGNDVDVAFRRGNTAAGKIGATSTSFGVGALTSAAASNSTAIGNNALSVSTGNNNVAVGQNALRNSATTAQWNTAVGNDALRGINSNAAQYNTAIGFEAMTGAGNISNTTAIGYHALFQNTVSNSTAIGYNALQGQVGNGTGNTGVGASVLNNNTDGDNNTAVGNQAGFAATGSENTLIGYFAGQFSTGSNNTAVGSNALKANGASANSVAVGVNALTLSTAANNTAIGFSAGSAITTGTGNVFIGNSAGSTEPAASSDKLYITNSATTPITSLIYGEFTPAARILRTNSTFQIGNPAGTGYVFPAARGTVGQLLQTDNVGVLTWQSPASFETDPQVTSTATSSIPRWNGTTLVDGVLVDNGTNVGVGMTPVAGNKLDVSGKTRTTSLETTNFQMTNGATANYVLQSDAAGNASWALPNNTLSVTRTNLSANQVVNSTGWQKITFNNILFDVNTEFNTGTNRFVATKLGYYEINAGFHTFNKNDAEYYGIGVYKNGTLYQETSAHHYGDKLISRTINCIINLAINDNVEIYIFNGNAPTTIDGFTGKTYFEVKQIR
jgi:hypothetical protein